MVNRQMVIGQRVELEHASTIRRIERERPPVRVAAQWIAQDHINEFRRKQYYTKLLSMEKQLRKR